MSAEEIIDKLGLAPHPEGGFYKETYRGAHLITLDNGSERSTSTLIYYLLKDTDQSHLHKISSDELWLFHEGEPLEIFMITGAGRMQMVTLGNRLELGEVPQFVIEANVWFAARVKNRQGFALVSCVVAPGFDFEDFVLADKGQLIASYPDLKDTIESLCL